MTEEVKMILEAIHSVDAKIDSVHDTLNRRMDQLDARMDRLETRMDQMETRMDRLDARMDRLETRMDQMETRMDQLDSKIDRVYNDLSGQIRDIHSIIENQMIPNLNVVAEGHLDLYRKFEQSEYLYVEKEYNVMRILVLEKDMIQVKRQLRMVS